MDLGQCMTRREDEEVFYVAACPYFQDYGHKMSEPAGFVYLHQSSMNTCVHEPMNRRGFLCSECIEGYSPSFTSPGYRCSNCTNVWYGIPSVLSLNSFQQQFFI